MEYDAFSSTQSQDLVSCGNCGRNFNAEALQRHGPICAKSTQKKRKTFDMSKQRSEGTDLQEFKSASRFKGGAAKKQTLPKIPAKTQQREIPAKKNNWRQKHEDFINAIRSAKGVTKALETGGPLPPPPPPSINPDYVQCQYCDRRFNQQAAERHINFCKTQASRLPNKKQPSATAQQRANARTQYKAPRIKSKTAEQTSPQSGYGPSGGYSSGSGYSSAGSGAGGGYSLGGGAGGRTGGASTGRAGSSKSAASSASAGGASSRYSGASSSRTSLSSLPHPQDAGGVSGRALRTGRTAETYSEARQLSAKQRSGMATGSTNTHTGPTPRGRHTPSGGSMTSNGSDYGDGGRYGVTNDIMKGRGGSGIAKFCHECGTKYPVTAAKFCCECGVRRATIT